MLLSAIAMHRHRADPSFAQVQVCDADFSSYLYLHGSGMYGENFRTYIHKLIYFLMTYCFALIQLLIHASRFINSNLWLQLLSIIVIMFFFFQQPACKSYMAHYLVDNLTWANIILYIQSRTHLLVHIDGHD